MLVQIHKYTNFFYKKVWIRVEPQSFLTISQIEPQIFLIHIFRGPDTFLISAFYLFLSVK